MTERDVVMHFIKRTTDGRATPSVFSKTTMQAKSLINSNYTPEEIIKVIDYVIDVKNVQMYSLGYISACIGSTLQEIKQQEALDTAKRLTKQMEGEVNHESGLTNNQSKIHRYGVESRFREGIAGDMPERTR